MDHRSSHQSRSEAERVEVSGFATFTLPAAPPPTARLHVRVIDASGAGAASEELARVSITPSDLSAGFAAVPFQLSAPFRAGPGDFLVAGHLSFDGSETVRPGDFLSTASHPASLTQSTARVDLALQQVK